MGKIKIISILIVALILICGIAMVVDAPTSSDDSLSLIPVSDSGSDSGQNCENGVCSVGGDASSSDAGSSSKLNVNKTSDKEIHDEEIDYDSKYYADSYIDGLYFCTDLEKAFKDAKEHNRNVMIVFDGAACVYCEYLKDEGLTDPAVQEEINDNDIILITQTSESPELSAQLGIHGTPTTVIFDAEGNELGRIVGYDSPHHYLSELKDYNGK